MATASEKLKQITAEVLEEGRVPKAFFANGQKRTGVNDCVVKGLPWISPLIWRNGIPMGNKPACVLPLSSTRMSSNARLMLNPRLMDEMMDAIGKKQVPFEYPEETGIPSLLCKLADAADGKAEEVKKLVGLFLGLESAVSLRFFPNIFVGEDRLDPSALVAGGCSSRGRMFCEQSLQIVLERLLRKKETVEAYSRRLSSILRGFLKRRNNDPGQFLLLPNDNMPCAVAYWFVGRVAEMKTEEEIFGEMVLDRKSSVLFSKRCLNKLMEKNPLMKEWFNLRKKMHEAAQTRLKLEAVLGRLRELCSSSGKKNGLTLAEVEELMKDTTTAETVAPILRKALLVEDVAMLDEAMSCYDWSRCAGQSLLPDCSPRVKEEDDDNRDLHGKKQVLTNALYETYQSIPKPYLVGAQKKIGYYDFPWRIVVRKEDSVGLLEEDGVARTLKEMYALFYRRYPGEVIPDPLNSALINFIGRNLPAGAKPKWYPLLGLTEDLFGYGGKVVSARYMLNAKHAVSCLLLLCDGEELSFFSRACGITRAMVDKVVAMEVTDCSNALSLIAGELSTTSSGLGSQSGLLRSQAENEELINAIGKFAIPNLPALQLGVLLGTEECMKFASGALKSMYVKYAAGAADGRILRRLQPLYTNVLIGLSLMTTRERRADAVRALMSLDVGPRYCGSRFVINARFLEPLLDLE